MAPSSYAADYIEALNRRNYSTTSYGTREAYAVDYDSYRPARRERAKERHVEEAPLKLASGEARGASQSAITPLDMVRLIAVMCIVGIFLILTVWMGAKATEVQYEINSLNRENIQLEDQVTMLGIKVEGAVSFESVEEYATGTLKMKYPKSSQCIYIDANAKADSNLISVIREKAYGG